MEELPEDLVAVLRARLPPHAAEALLPKLHCPAALPLHLRKSQNKNADTARFLLDILCPYIATRPNPSIKHVPPPLVALSLAQVRDGTDGVTVTRTAVSAALQALWNSPGPPLRYLDLSCCDLDVVGPEALAEYAVWLRGLRVLRVAGCRGICDGAFARMTAAASHQQYSISGDLVQPLEPSHESLENQHVSLAENCSRFSVSRCFNGTGQAKQNAPPTCESLAVLDVSFCRNAWWRDVVYSFPNLEVCIAPGTMLGLEARLRRVAGIAAPPGGFIHASHSHASQSTTENLGLASDIEDDFHYHPILPDADDNGRISSGPRNERPTVLNIDLRRAAAEDNVEHVKLLFNAISNPVLDSQASGELIKRPRVQNVPGTAPAARDTNHEACKCKGFPSCTCCASKMTDDVSMRLQLLHTYATACPVPEDTADFQIREEDLIGGVVADSNQPFSGKLTRKITPLNGLLSLAAANGSARVARLLVEDANYCALLPRSFPPFAQAMMLSDAVFESDPSENPSSHVRRRKNSTSSRKEFYNALLPRAPYSLGTPVVESLVVLASARCDYNALDALLPACRRTSARPCRGILAEREQNAFARAMTALFLPPAGVAFPKSAEEDNALFRIAGNGSSSSKSWNKLVPVGKRPSGIIATIAIGRCMHALIAAGARLMFAPYVLHTAAYLGSRNALDVMLCAKEFNELRHGEFSAESSYVENDFALAHSLLRRNENRESVLESAARGESKNDAKDCVELVLGTMSQICNSGGHGWSDRFDVDAANALVVALGVGNESVASLIYSQRPQCLKRVFETAGSPGCALRSIARRIGRASRSDADILEIGRAILMTAIDIIGPCSFRDWAKIHCKDDIGRSILHYAVCASDPSFARMLIHLGVDVDEFDDDGITPLCMAVSERGSRACIELLLIAGADVHIEDARGRTPLHLAAEAKNGLAAALLIHYGSSPMHADHYGVSPIHLDSHLVTRASAFVVTLSPPARMNSPLSVAAQDSSREVVPCACGSPNHRCKLRPVCSNEVMPCREHHWNARYNAMCVANHGLSCASSPDFGRLVNVLSVSDGSVCADEENESRSSISDDGAAVVLHVAKHERRFDTSFVSRLLSFRRNNSAEKG